MAQELGEATADNLIANRDLSEAQSAWSNAKASRIAAREAKDEANTGSDERAKLRTTNAVIEAQQAERAAEHRLKAARAVADAEQSRYDAMLKSARDSVSVEQDLAQANQIADDIASSDSRSERRRARRQRAREREERRRQRAEDRRARKGRRWNEERQVRDERRAREQSQRERRNQGFVLRHSISQEHFDDWSRLGNEITTLENQLGETRAEIRAVEREIDEAEANGESTIGLEIRLFFLQIEEAESQSELEDKEREARWHQYGGAWPLSELDCTSPKYAICRPACPPEQRCDCKPPEGGSPGEPQSPGKKHKKDQKDPEDGQTAPSGALREGYKPATPDDSEAEDGGEDDQAGERRAGRREVRDADDAHGRRDARHPDGSRLTVAPPPKKRGPKGGDSEDQRPERPVGGGFDSDQRKYYVRPIEPGKSRESFGLRWAKGADPCKKGSVTYLLVEELYSNGRTGKLSASAGPNARKALQALLDRLCKAKRTATPSSSSGAAGGAQEQAKKSSDDAGYEAIRIDDILDTYGVGLDPVDTKLVDATKELAKFLQEVVEASGFGAAIRASGDLLVDPQAVQVVEMFMRNELNPGEAAAAIMLLDSPLGGLLSAESATELSRGEFKQAISELGKVGLTTGAGLTALAVILGVRRKKRNKGTVAGSSNASSKRKSGTEAPLERSVGPDDVTPPEFVHRGGRKNPANLKPRPHEPGLSTFEEEALWDHVKPDGSRYEEAVRIEVRALSEAPDGGLVIVKTGQKGHWEIMAPTEKELAAWKESGASGELHPYVKFLKEIGEVVKRPPQE